MKQLFILLLLNSACSQGFAQHDADTSLIYFPFDQSRLTTEAQNLLGQFAISYKASKNPGRLILRGHCDAKGSDAYNEALSEKRVAAVKDYLLQKGFDADAFTEAKGYGERLPLNENLSEEDRRLNRRVELIWEKETVATEPRIEEQPEEPADLKQQIDSVKEGETLRLRNINFYGGRHTFLPQSYAALAELLDVMKNNPKLEIEIQGHICCFTGGEDGMDFDANNRRLSYNRARAVYDYLVKNGIDERRMSYKGFAGTQLLVYPERSEADRTTNRRVEIKIISK